jgi:hypothetical protein
MRSDEDLKDGEGRDEGRRASLAESISGAKVQGCLRAGELWSNPGQLEWPWDSKEL